MLGKEVGRMNERNLYEEIFTVAHDLYERGGRVKGRDLDNWLEAERIVRTLRKIAGEDGKRYISINVPAMERSEGWRNTRVGFSAGT
jgi:Protein of unknown function (DUF2934)